MISATTETDQEAGGRFFIREGKNGAKTFGANPVGHYWLTSTPSRDRYLVIVEEAELFLYRPGAYSVSDETDRVTLYGFGIPLPLNRRGEKAVHRYIRRMERGNARMAKLTEQARRFVERHGGEVQR